MPDSTIAGLPAVAHLADDDQFAIERPAPANANHHVTALQIWDDLPDRVRSVIVTPYAASTQTGPAWLIIGNGPAWSGLGTPLDDLEICAIWGQWLVPEDYESGLTVQPVVIMQSGVATPKVLYGHMDVTYFTCGEDYDTAPTASSGWKSESVSIINGGSKTQCLPLTTLAVPASIGDFLHMRFQRDAQVGTGIDTVGDEVDFWCFKVSYTRHVNQ